MAIATKTCPDCGAINDASDLFCKECGSSLAMTASSSETAAFRPVAAASTGTVSIAPVAAPQPTPVPTTYPAYTGTYAPEPESARGAVLGWIAATLMLLIVGFYLWSSVISDATRDRLTGWI